MPTLPLVYEHADILVVDDNPVNVELLLQLLEDYGYKKVRGESDPRQLGGLFANKLPDLLLLDIRMPYLDGYQVLELLKSQWQQDAPPVIVLSAQIDAHTRLRALNLGARDFISKPFERLEVLQRIHNTLELHFLLRQRISRAEQLESLVKQRTADLQRLVVTEQITERPNRRGLLEILANKLEKKALRHVPEASEAILYFIVLEGMDDIARVHGYGITDKLNQAVGIRLEQLSAALQLQGQHSQQLGVWGGNEWLLLELGDASAQLIAKRADELITQLNQAFEVGHLLLYLKVRVGISHSGFTYQTPEHLVRLAAMSLPSNNNVWQSYQPRLEEQLLKQNRYRQALHSAIDNQELFLVYQPKVNLQTGQVIAAEALLRWSNPELGFISPVDFIPIAEASGDIIRIGDWVMDRAMAQLERWLKAGVVAPNFKVAVNVAALQLVQPHFAEQLIHRLQHSTIPKGSLEVEVTESGLMQNMELALSQLQYLATHGVSIAIDDFGTGYSSLAYLKSMPISVLKIDRAFISQMDTDRQDLKLVETVISMARNLGCITVAEGVERPEHIALLSDMQCNVAQGYWYSPPLPPEVFIDYLQIHNSA